MPFNPPLFFHIPVQLISVVILFKSDALNYHLPFINKDDNWQERSLHWFSNVLINQIFSPGLQQVLIIIAVIQGHGTEQS